MKMNKNKLSSIIALGAALCLIVGSFAYFSDRVTANASVTSASASDIIKVDPDPTNPNAPEDPQAALQAVWNRQNPNKDIVKPGDKIDLDFDLKNIGDSDIDVKETIVLTSSKNLTAGSPEWRLLSAAVADAYGAYCTDLGVTGNTGITVETIGTNQIKYTLPAFKLAKDATQARKFQLVFDKYASNVFQGSTCTVDYLAELRQHVDSIGLEEQWDAIRTSSSTIRFEGNLVAAVPAA